MIKKFPDKQTVKAMDRSFEVKEVTEVQNEKTRESLINLIGMQKQKKKLNFKLLPWDSTNPDTETFNNNL